MSERSAVAEEPVDPDRIRWTCWCATWGTPNDKPFGAEPKCWRCGRPREQAVPKGGLIVPARTEVQQPASPDDLRAAGWSVAVHNDYRSGGKSFTFWLLTHHDGRWLKGEGLTDAEALDQIRAQLAPSPLVAVPHRSGLTLSASGMLMVGPPASTPKLVEETPPRPPPPERKRAFRPRHVWEKQENPLVRVCIDCTLEEHREHGGEQNGVSFVYRLNGQVVATRLDGKPGVPPCPPVADGVSKSGG